MKNIFYALGIVSIALGLSSCEETWDKNPVLQGHEGIVKAEFLNEPVLGEQTIMLTSDNSTGTFHLTASQPYYGFAAVATYRVQCSLTEDFANYREINQDFYDCAEINPINGDVAAALEYLSNVKNDQDLPLPYQTLYMRLYTYIQQSQENTQYYSNVVSFKNVSANYLAIWVAGQPANLYLRGGMVDGWGAVPEFQFMTGEEENSWETNTITIPAGTEFKVADSEWAPINLGAGDDNVVTPGEAYALQGGDNPGNLTIKVDFTGKAYLYLDKGNYTLILDQE
ncbi:MAG: hypothetical protein J1E16_06030 [Muribaculaceae bacterium]|nr:hypothetical protein [Muribaculaceae bacterium]